MDDRKKGFKLSIFLFLAFFIVSAFFITWVYKIYYNAKDKIATETKKTDCLSFSFAIENPKKDAAGDRVIFDIYNKQTSIPITSMTLSREGVETHIDTGLIEPGETKQIEVDNAPANVSGGWIFPEGCPDLKEELVII